MQDMKTVKIHQLTESNFPENTPYCPSQMMSYIIETEEGSLVVIDGGNLGDADYLLEYLQKLGGENPKVAAWFMTHAHNDHYDALNMLLYTDREPQIDKLYYNFPDEEYRQKYFDKGTIDSVYHFLRRVKEHELPVETVVPGDEIRVDNVTFKIIYMADEKNITYNQPNNGSIVIRMEACGQSVLFTGDLGAEAGDDMVSKLDKELVQADIVQMAHHGQSGTNEAFYQAVNPKACLWTTPLWLWDNDFGKGFDTHIFTTVETRRWMKKLGVKHHVVTKDGTQVITLPVDFDSPWGIEDCLPEE